MCAATQVVGYPDEDTSGAMDAGAVAVLQTSAEGKFESVSRLDVSGTTNEENLGSDVAAGSHMAVVAAWPAFTLSLPGVIAAAEGIFTVLRTDVSRNSHTWVSVGTLSPVGYKAVKKTLHYRVAIVGEAAVLTQPSGSATIPALVHTVRLNTVGGIFLDASGNDFSNRGAIPEEPVASFDYALVAARCMASTVASSSAAKSDLCGPIFILSPTLFTQNLNEGAMVAASTIIQSWAGNPIDDAAYPTIARPTKAVFDEQVAGQLLNIVTDGFVEISGVDMAYKYDHAVGFEHLKTMNQDGGLIKLDTITPGGLVVLMTHCRLSGGYASKGGCIAVHGAAVTIQFSIMEDCIAGIGGMLYADTAAQVTLANSGASGCRALITDGAVAYIIEASLTVSNENMISTDCLHADAPSKTCPVKGMGNGNLPVAHPLTPHIDPCVTHLCTGVHRQLCSPARWRLCCRLQRRPHAAASYGQVQQGKRNGRRCGGAGSCC